MSWSTVARAHGELQTLRLIDRHADTPRATEFVVRDAAAVLGSQSENPEQPPNGLLRGRVALHNLSYSNPDTSPAGDTSPNGAMPPVQVGNAGGRAPASFLRSSSSPRFSDSSFPPAFSGGARCANGGGSPNGAISPSGEGGEEISPSELESRLAELAWIQLPQVREQLARRFDVATIKSTKRAVLDLPKVQNRGATLVRLLRGGGVKPATRPAPTPKPAAKPAATPTDEAGAERFRAALHRALESLGADVREQLEQDQSFLEGDDVDQARHPKVRAAFSAALKAKAVS